MSSLIAGHVTDVDAGAVQGIAVTGVTAVNGNWQYSPDAGLTWTDMGAVSATSSLLLRSIDEVRYLPDAKNGGTDTITFRAWDQSGATVGQQGTSVNTLVNGTTTPFSVASATSTISVTDVNDAPVLTATNHFTTITEDQTANPAIWCRT